MKWSLLIALGVVPSACSSTVESLDSKDEGNSSCTSPSVDEVTGIEICAEGFRHRPSAKTCLAPGEAMDTAGALPRAAARLCFGFASAYAGYEVGPGPLDVCGNLETTSLGAVVELVIAEGCFGETSATLEALDAAELATDSEIVRAYRLIAADEQRHAELAFRFVAWALEQDRALVASRVRQALARAQQSKAVSEVVAPCLETLLTREALAA